jgi:hypothetical protein
MLGYTGIIPLILAAGLVGIGYLIASARTASDRRRERTPG